MISNLPRSGFKFVNYSGTYMLRLETADDLAAIPLLDEVFWIATSAPIHHLRCDQKFLSFLDADADSRILSRDVRRVYAWMLGRLSDLTDVTAASDVLSLSKLTDTPEAQAIATAARRILTNLGKPDAEQISLAEVRDHQAYRSKGFHNGDGVIPPGAVADNEAMVAFIGDVVDTVGGTAEMTGAMGVSQANLELFLKCAQELLDWRARSEAENEESAGLFPLGDDTADGYAKFCALREPIERYFRLCRLTALNQMLERKTPIPESPVDIQADAEAVNDAMSIAPLAKPLPEEVLQLTSSINPFFVDQLNALVADVLVPILDDDWTADELSIEDWEGVIEAFAMYEGWLNAKSGGEVEKLGPETLRGYLDGELPAELLGLITTDQEIGKELAVVQDLEYLLLTQQNFLELASNFISFHTLYDPDHRALFELGRHIISGRIFTLNMQVKDINAHSKLATEAGILLLYSEVTSADKTETFHMVTPVTSMTLGRLGPERHGVLFDLKGRQWDTRVVKVIDNPISLWDAIRKPFVRIGSAIAGAFNKLVSGAEKQLDSSISKQFTEAEKTVATGMTTTDTNKAIPPAATATPTATATASPAGNSGGGIGQVFLGGSMAVAALGSSFAFIASKLNQDGAWLFAVKAIAVGLIIIIIATVISAWLRLRRRNLGSLLEASGWAINAEMRVSWRLARVLAPKKLHPAGFTKIPGDLSRFLLKKVEARVKEVRHPDGPE